MVTEVGPADEQGSARERVLAGGGKHTGTGLGWCWG